MTHTLHREGDRESLSDDFVVLAMAAAGINDDQATNANRAFLDLALEHDADEVNMGTMETGSIYQVDFETIREDATDGRILHAVFDDFDELESFLFDLAELELGISVVVTGLFDKTEEVCENVGERSDADPIPKPHTARWAAGIKGNTDRLPEEWVLEFSTMCGHGMISFNLVRDMREAVADGRISAEEAAKRIGQPCVCGIFNTSRAERLLTAIT
ncbi:MAG: hypothetical protein ACOCY7_03965 [Halodesulfurarchaeum sp.]